MFPPDTSATNAWANYLNWDSCIAQPAMASAWPGHTATAIPTLVQHGRRLLRIQVKSCFSREKNRHTGFFITVSGQLAASKGKTPYSNEDIDLIAAFIAPHDAWYLIPVESLASAKIIRLYPADKKLKRRGGFYEQYREAWHLMKE